MFEEFKRKNLFITGNKKYEKISHMLYFDDKRAAIKSVNHLGQDVESGNYKGSDRLIREIETILEKVNEKNSFTIDWGNESKNIYLDEHPYLLELLKRSETLVDEKMQKIDFYPNNKKLLLKLEENNEKIVPVLKYGEIESKYVFLSDNSIFSDKMIYEIEPIGEGYLNFNLFLKEFEKDYLDKYLSLLFSNFENMGVIYKDYDIVFNDKEEATGVIVIEKVDSEGDLHLRIGYKTAGIGLEWFSEYNVSTAVYINQLEEKIILKEIETENADNNIKTLLGLIEKIRKSLKTKEENFYVGNTLILKEAVAKELITNNLSFLLNTFEMLGSEKLIDYKLRIVRPKLNLNLSHNIDFFEGDAWVDFNGEEKSILDVIETYKSKSYIPLNDGTNAIISKNYIEKLERIFKKKKDGIKVSFFDMPLVDELVEEKILKERFPKVREIYEGFNVIDNSIAIDVVINGELRHYQEYGVKWMKYLYDNNLGGCLADDMGLGKTIQAITLFSGIYPENRVPSLIVLPKSLIFNWEAEINKFNPSLTYYVYYGVNREIDDAVKKNLIITTYGTLRSDIESFRKKEFLVVMLDESQNIKNMNSQAYKSVMLLNCSKRFALSGTPIENNLSELYSLFSFLNPSMFGGYAEFNRDYAIPIQKNNDEVAMEQLKKKIYPFILRRIKGDVLKELPEKVENILYVEMDAEHKAFYNERREFYKNVLDNQIKEIGFEKSQFFIFQALGELRQIATNPEGKSDGKIVSQKREVLFESVLDAISNKHKILIFTNYLSSVENISEDLEKNGIMHLTMTGATKDRQKIVEEFQSNRNCKVLLMTLKTGGVGLNLTEADTVFIYDPWWNKAAESQAIDRTHRIGQKNTVFSYKMITKGTIEEKILMLQEKKGELFNNLISSDSSAIKNINKEDIEFILGV